MKGKRPHDIRNKISAQHGFVYRKSGNFAAWPANGGIWHWEDEILVQFQVGTYAENWEHQHSVDRDKAIRKILERSLDGGETWTHEEIIASRDTSETHTKIDFTPPDFAMQHSEDKFLISYNLGETWIGDYNLPYL